VSTANKDRFALWPITITQSIAWDVAYIQKHGMAKVDRLSFHCRSCGAPSGVACDDHKSSNAPLRWCLARAEVYENWKALFLKHYGETAEFVERDARGKSWLEARVAIDKAPPVIK
jgi:hypothetical protein